MQLRTSSRPDTQAPQFVLKAIIVGDSGVGKSCLGLRCVGEPFRRPHELTIGVEFLSCSLWIGDQTVKVRIWDTAGQESFKAITRAYYRTASVCFLVYDVTDRVSFVHLRRWHEDVRAHAAPSVVVAVVGNKADLTRVRAVSFEEATGLAEELGASYYETSALSGEGVQEALRAALTAAVEKEQESSAPAASAAEPPGWSGGCC